MKKIESLDLSYPSDFINWDGKSLSLKSEQEIKEQLRHKKEAGLNWIMTGGLQYVEPAAFDLQEGARMFKRFIDEFGIQISSHHCVLHSYLPPGENQKPIRDVMKRTVETCAVLEPNALVIHIGMASGKYKTNVDVIKTYEELEKEYGAESLFQIMVDNYKFMGEEALKSNMNLALENLSNFCPFSDQVDLPRFINAVNLPNVGYCIDAGHAHIFGESLTEWLKIAGQKLFETHFHDNQAKLANTKITERFIDSTPQIDEHLPVGFGTINWIDVIKTLKEIDFKGPVGFECQGWPMEDKAEGLKHAVCWWRTCEKYAEER